MRLAFCLFKYFPYGGLQRDFLRIARACLAQGHMIDVYTMLWDGTYEPGLAIRTIPVKGIRNHKRREDFVKQIQPYLNQGHYDLIVGFNKMPGLDVYYAADTCYQAKAHLQRSWLYRLRPRYRRTKAYEEAVFNKDAKTKILLLSPTQQAEFTQYYHTPENRFYLLPPGIERDRIAPSDATEIRNEVREEYGLTEADFMLLAIGSGFKTKGLDRTLRAIAALPEALKTHCLLFVIGKDDPKPFQRLAKKLKISKRVVFLGGRKDIPPFLLAGDVLLHPAYNENTGTVLLEALVAGLPVLASENCGYAHYIRDAGAGVVLPAHPFQQAQFNTTLATVLSSADIRASASWNGLAFAKTADIYSLPERVVSYIESLR
jgi:UDP-glucose:(heptosyl)LPS alpha-1,3-glucosyltransferase